MKVRQIKKYVNEQLVGIPLRKKWRCHTGMLEMYVREDRHHDWHEAISLSKEHIKSGRYNDNFLKANLDRSIRAILRRI